jgi:peptidoglycan hydrolase CwlO-like protein
MSSQKKARGLPGMKEGPLVQMLDHQKVQQAAADEAKKLVDAAALPAERLVDATKEAEETATAAAAAAALSSPEEAQASLSGSTNTARMYLTVTAACCSLIGVS